MASFRHFYRNLPCAVALALLSACATTQLTSGADYVNRGRITQNSTIQSFQGKGASHLDAEIRDIANIEPDLSFPARIGLARINRHNLTAVPLDELEIWADAREDLPFAAGEFVPVSPLITASVAAPLTQGQSPAELLMANIRRGSARQHLDYVLIYEVNHISRKNRNALSIADISILGLFTLPSRNVEIESTASAILMDVRSGYPYGTASAFKDAKRVSTSNRAQGTQEKLEDKNVTAVVDLLSDDVSEMLLTLKLESADLNRE